MIESIILCCIINKNKLIKIYKKKIRMNGIDYLNIMLISKLRMRFTGKKSIKISI